MFDQRDCASGLAGIGIPNTFRKRCWKRGDSRSSLRCRSRTWTCGDAAFERTVTRQFIDKVPGQLQELKAAYESQDFSRFKLRAHDFKTSVAIMGLLPVLDDKLGTLELTTEQNTLSEGVLTEVEQILTTAVEEAQRLLASYTD